MEIKYFSHNEKTIILPVTPEDIDIIVDLESEIFGSEAFTRDHIIDYLNINILFNKIVKEEPDKTRSLLGYITFSKFNPENRKALSLIKKNYTKTKTKIAHLSNLAVSPLYRQHGLACLLFDDALMKLRALGFEFLYLEVKTKNEAALKFYDKYGFQILIESKNYYSITNENAYFMIARIIPP